MKRWCERLDAKDRDIIIALDRWDLVDAIRKWIADNAPGEMKHDPLCYRSRGEKGYCSCDDIQEWNAYREELFKRLDITSKS